MKNEIVKYNNDLNTVNLGGWTKEEMNLFFTIIAKIRDKGVEKIILDTDDLKELTQFGDKHNKRWIDIMNHVGAKIIKLNYFEKNSSSNSYMTLFEKVSFPQDENNKQVSITVSREFEYVVNKISEKFTTYELSEFVGLRSIYSKTAYRLLKQWRTVGKKRFNIETFRKVMYVPENYRMSDIDKRVLNKIEKELSFYFKGFKIKKIKENKVGSPVVAIEFTWKKEKTNKYNPNKYKKRKEIIPAWFKNEKTIHSPEKTEISYLPTEEELKSILENIFEK